MTVSRVDLDLAKSDIQVHAAGAAGRAVVRKPLRRAQRLLFSAMCHLARSA